MKNKFIIEKYLKENEESFSENTYQTYKIAINQLIDFMAGRQLSSLDSEIMMEFLGKYINWSPATKHLKITVIRDFVRYAAENNYINKMPVINLILPKIPDRLTPRILPKDMYLIREAAQNNIRDRLIIDLFIRTGLRISEICGILVDNIDHEKRTIFIRKTKGNKQQFTYYTAECAVLIKQYLETRQDDHPFLFPSPNSKKQKPLSRQAVYKLIIKYVKISGADPPITPHSIRHEFASNCVDRGFEVSEVQELLNHLLQRSTLRYLNNSPDNDRQQYDQYYHE